MKTSAFLIRAAICFLLSLIPAKDFENRIYSARVTLRGIQAGAHEVLIIQTPSGQLPTSIDLKTSSHSLFLDAQAGDLTLDTDTDGMVRLSRLALSPSPKLTAAATTTSPHLINYLGPAGSIPRCQWPHCSNLKDKIVVIDTDPDSTTQLRTPWGEMSRAEILANDLHTLAKRRPIYEASWIERSLLIITMIFLGALYIIYYPVLISAIAVSGTGIVVVLILFQIIFHLFDIYIPAANIGGSLLLTYLIFTGYRLAFQENLQWRSVKQAQYLKELDQMKTNFLSLVSHDLKTPLAKIQAQVERLKRDQSAPSDIVESIENSNNELKHYITSILNLSRLESQKVILNKKSNDINRLIGQALKRLRPLAQQKGLTIEERLDPLFSIECDEDLMRQVVTNLIDNAIKYSPTGSRIIVRSTEEEGFVRVEVEDFGPGIPKDQLPMMFRKFSRFLRPIHEHVKGTGLGLYLSKYFIELHGGTIRVKSVEGQGTVFTFTLPLHGVESEAILG